MTEPTPYGTPDTPRLSVRGEAHIEAEPELARIGITVTARNTDRRATLTDLTHRNNTTLDLVKTYGDHVEKLETGTFTLTPEFTRHGRGERIRTYHGRVHITAELNDFTALGELATRLADLELTRVDGPWWSLRRTSPVHADARRQAVHEAVQRAREYADALGTTLDALVELADTAADDHTWTHAPTPRAMFGAAAPGGAAPDDTPSALDLEPQRQQVRAQVNARFTLHPPTL
ncbi:SIMPL domain-containing protein [Streptomyces beihaiensis]|uniref:SIMPL domain-containing protein n=1 Tax=Streptomyces beihaiensis TaxID=2984495 RepID=A0ABT3U1G4_9ACTN|nr:SIMPL domain-containing protein [Streptomyces beihaiensis]MCX3062095.1 SIMPL domain-containing protein [Streptomyces beihaiensis]